jgi:DNA-binding NarL/FixJ family response regulator
MTLEKWNGEKITVAEAVRRLATLTERQHAVFALRCQGLPYKEIANRLVVAESDVKTHMGAVYQKLGLDNLPQSLRIKALNETFCPLLSEGSLLVADPDEKDPV